MHASNTAIPIAVCDPGIIPRTPVPCMATAKHFCSCVPQFSSASDFMPAAFASSSARQATARRLCTQQCIAPISQASGSSLNACLGQRWEAATREMSHQRSSGCPAGSQCMQPCV